MLRIWLFFSFIFYLGAFSQDKIIEKIEIKGAKKTKTSFIEKLLETKKGAALDSIQLEQDMRLLIRLPIISYARYEVMRNSNHNYDIIIHVEENITLIPDIGFWTAINNRFSYRVGVTEYDLLGRNIALGAYYQNNGYDTYAINFRAPNLFSKEFGLAVNHQNWKSEEPLFFDGGSANYLYNNISTEVLGIYQISFKHQLTTGINFFQEKYTYLFGNISPDVPRFLNPKKTLFKLLYKYNNLDYFFHHLEGFKNEFIVQYVTAINDFQGQFFITWNDFFYFKRFGENGNWANRFRLGIATNNDSPFAPFALDNNLNLRGVGILVDRGTASIVYNTEYRHTFYDKKWLTIQGNLFIDAGSWRNPGGKLRDFWEPDNMEFFSGFGIRFINKKIYNAVFRIDYGRSLTDSKKGIVFGIGQYF